MVCFDYVGLSFLVKKNIYISVLLNFQTKGTDCFWYEKFNYRTNYRVQWCEGHGKLSIVLGVNISWVQGMIWIGCGLIGAGCRLM